jgi:hypothetical protein
MNRKHELVASLFADASISIWYESTVVDVSINFERLSLELNLVGVRVFPNLPGLLTSD